MIGQLLICVGGKGLGDTMSKENFFNGSFEKEKVLCGCILAEIRTPSIAMILESAGLDFFIIDMEHGTFTYETVNDIIVSCRGLNIAPFVRVPGVCREPIQKVLDAGARGLLLPRIESKEQVIKARDLINYAPEGSRGLSLRRAHSGFAKSDPFEYTVTANKNIVLMIQIETKTGVENIEAITDVGGIDVLFVGPSDLSHSYGTGRDADVEQAIHSVIEIGKKKAIFTGIHHSNVSMVAELVAKGMRFISINTEVGAMINELSGAANAIRQIVVKT